AARRAAGDRAGRRARFATGRAPLGACAPRTLRALRVAFAVRRPGVARGRPVPGMRGDSGLRRARGDLRAMMAKAYRTRGGAATSWRPRAPAAGGRASRPPP